MAEPKDIGKAFKEKLKDFDQSESRLSWDDIASQLPKKERGLLPYWVKSYRMGVLALLFFLGIGYFTYNSFNDNTDKENLDHNTTNLTQENCLETEERSIENPKVNIEKITKEKRNEKPNKKLVQHNQTNQNNQISRNNSSLQKAGSLTPKNTRNSDINEIAAFNVNNKNSKSKKNDTTKTSKNSTTTDFQHEKPESILTEIDNTENTSAKTATAPTTVNGITQTKENKIEIDQNPEHLEKDTELTPSILGSKEEKTIPNETKKDTLIFMHPIQETIADKISVGFYLTPTYLSTRSGSLIDDRLLDRTNHGRLSIGYGILLKNHFSNKVALRIGLNRLKTSNVTKSVLASQLPSVIRNQWALQLPDQMIPNDSEVDLIQKLVYTEGVIGIQYKVSDQKIITSAVGGFNVNLLGKHRITLKTPNPDVIVNGENNIKKLGFGIHLGANLKYKLTDRIFVNIDPLINYQFNEASNNLNSFNLLYFTVQSGLSYKFK